MYFVMVLLLLLLLPAASVGMEAIGVQHPQGLMFLMGKWLVFWGVGVRLFLAGTRQVIQPRFTAQEIFQIQSAEPLPIVRELGFANLSMGTLGVSSLFETSWIVPAAIAGGLYYGLAGLGHIGQKGKNAKEYTAMVSDGFVFVLLAAFLVSHFSG